MNLNIYHKIQTCYYEVLSLLLYLKNLLLRKKLVLTNLIHTNKIIICGNQTELNWTVTGCHKILIKGSVILPGNFSFSRILLDKKINSIEITFYGVGGQKVIKKIVIETTSPSVLHNFTPKTSIPSPKSTLLSKGNLRKMLVNSFNYREPKRVKLVSPKIVPQNLKFNFEPFIKSNYPIKY